MITVTMTATLGSGGRELAQVVAETLGLTLVDHQIVDDAARALRLPETEVAHAEQPPHLLDRLFRTLAAQPVLADWGQSAVAPTLAPDEVCRAALHQEIERWADQGGCLILGHGAQMALGRRPRVIHLLCHASREDRVEMICRDEWLGAREAERRVDAADRCQQEWHRAAYGVGLYDPRHYDITMDLSRLTLDAARRLAVQAITDREQSGRPRLVQRGLRALHPADRPGA